MDLSIIIVSWNTESLLRTCLAGLSAAMGPLDSEIIVVDNASTDGSADMVAADFPCVKLVRNAANDGYARANNRGIGLSQGCHVLLLNSDTMLASGALAALVAFMQQHPRAGACSPRLVRPDGSPQPFAFGDDPSPAYLLRRGISRLLLHRSLHDWAARETQEVAWASGACLLLRREALDELRGGPLDPVFFMYFEDNDLCLRLRQAGWKIYYYPAVSVIHLGGRSLRLNPGARSAYGASLRYFYRKHYGLPARAALGAGLIAYERLARVSRTRNENSEIG